ncbi:MAG: glycosyltransferase family 4 protein [Clostridia bacterium]|nr:glycosyltransferase family 4 protein [Clostridia bacterium]
MFGHKRIPSREGGIEVVVTELSTRMAALGHSVTCYNRSGHHVSGSEFDSSASYLYKGVRLKNVWTLDKRGLAAMSASVSAAFCAAFGKYDVVHIHAEGPSFMCWLPKLLRKRVIVTIHGLDWARAKWGKFASWYIKSGEKNAVRFADEIIVLSENVQKYFRQTYGRDTVFIPNGVVRMQKREAEEIQKLWGLQKDSYVLFLGRLVPEKGVHYLIEAWKSIKTDKKLVIAGGSSDTQDYMDRLKALAGDDVLFTGFQQGQALEELYSNAYIYVLPSDLEGMPLSLLEAMSYGNCCMVSDIEECAKVVEDHAAVFEKGNISDLQGKLQELLDHPEEVKKYKDGASVFICKKYSWDDVVDKTLGLYRTNNRHLEKRAKPDGVQEKK